MDDARIGIYEKALPTLDGWPARMAAAAEAGFDFIEIAIDESDERLARLDWSAKERASLHRASVDAGMPVYNLILSAHRKYPLGSPTPANRERALDIMRRGIDFAVETGIRVIQLSGYYVFDEPHDSKCHDRFLDGLDQATGWAAEAGIVLGLENMDGEDITTVERAMHFVSLLDSPWLQVYPDIGNLAGNGLDVCAELQRAQGHLIGIHLKDARRGEYRRVHFGEGIVPFSDVFATLNKMNYGGTFLIEMWNDDNPAALQIISDARQWILEQMKVADVQV